MRKSGALVFAFLCALTLAARTGPDYSQFQKKLPKDQQVLHALDRLTFGPRPGDVEAVKKMGLKKWIDLQLHPERIKENPALAVKLEPLESLRMTQAETASRYPNPQMVRAVAQGRQPLPEDPVLRAAVERMARRLKVKTGDNSSGPPEPALSLEELLSGAQIKVLRSGTTDQKKNLLSSLPEDKLEDVVNLSLIHI